ncbi:antibiotic biosynthesis monooxygenase [Marinobacter sp. JSM 1782161]|uniref:antibiotic biosynthesis monooxygenase n=1 Tax=Marinobacter sp. JSM 1782161 TaxID=2685906 RepID=UPI0014039002|nr:antibiotic biosynthesis monooxygenase [Marinobacter sp. JSM 1782161]
MNDPQERTEPGAPRESGAHYESGRTIFIRHTVRPRERARYETWLRQIIEAAARFPGHQGVHVLRPPEGSQAFEIAVRFSGAQQAEAWLDSDIRRELVADILPALEQDEQVEIRTGIEFWFTPPASGAKQPTRWKQWLVTTAVIWPLTMVVPLLWQPVFEALPTLSTWGIRHGLIAGTIVALVVYLVMPRVVRLVAPWLFR